MGRTKAFAARTASVAAALIAATLATASPASATTPVSGTWGDNPTLCATSSSCLKTGNVVRMWQTILYSEGLYSDIDGVYGTNTANATKAWQKSHGLAADADGWVGPTTWNKAYSTYIQLPDGTHPYNCDGNLTYAYYCLSYSPDTELRANHTNGDAWAFAYEKGGIWHDYVNVTY